LKLLLTLNSSRQQTYALALAGQHLCPASAWPKSSSQSGGFEPARIKIEIRLGGEFIKRQRNWPISSLSTSASQAASRHSVNLPMLLDLAAQSGKLGLAA